MGWRSKQEEKERQKRRSKKKEFMSREMKRKRSEYMNMAMYDETHIDWDDRMSFDDLDFKNQNKTL